MRSVVLLCGWLFLLRRSTYGFNQSKFSGYLSMNRGVCECNIEIYHEGDMVYVEE